MVIESLVLRKDISVKRSDINEKGVGDKKIEGSRVKRKKYEVKMQEFGVESKQLTVYCLM